METDAVFRGRLIDHIGFVVADLAASRRFYGAIFGVLGIPIGGEGEDYFWADELYVSSVSSSLVVGMATGRVHLAFQAEGPDMVAAFHRTGLEAGGTDNGGPGLRDYHNDYFAAFLLDPDGNNIEAVFHGPSERSAAAVKVSY